MADVVSYLLDLMRVRATAYIGKNLHAPWSMSVESDPNFARFHLVLSGGAWIELPESGKKEQLGAGDFAIIPNGCPHIISDQVGRKRGPKNYIPHIDITPEFEPFDLDGTATHLLCGYFRISENMPQTILDRLPNLLVERRDGGLQDQKVKLISDLIGLELSEQTAPSPIALNRSTEILCVYAMHRWLQNTLMQDTNISALADPRLHVVLDKIQADPANSWTVESLAQIYGQSRTAFAIRFKAAMGTSPMTYVTNWRVKLARKMLEESSLPLDEVAARTGYADTNAFNRAFKRETGTAPGAFRRVSRR